MTARATVAAVLGRILAISLGLLAACYSPAQPDCGFVCGPGGACPSDYACAADGVCHRIGAPANLTCAVDARPDTPRPIDAPPADADVTPPQVLATDPVSGATNVPTSATVRVQFSEPVTNVGTTTFALESSGTPIAGTVTEIDPFNYQFAPTSPLPAGAPIDITLYSAIQDGSGNALATYGFSFTTAP
jgi:hypothetical protein